MNEKETKTAKLLWIDLEMYYSIAQISSIMKNTNLVWFDVTTLWRKIKDWSLKSMKSWKWNSYKIKWVDFINYYFVKK